MFTREFVENAYKTTENDLIWKPIYPNNMPDNGVEGYYCLMLHKDKEGKYSGRKYSIVFQYEEAEKGSEEKDDMEIIRDVFEMIAEMKEKMGQVLQSIRF